MVINNKTLSHQIYICEDGPYYKHIWFLHNNKIYYLVDNTEFEGKLPMDDFYMKRAKYSKTISCNDLDSFRIEWIRKIINNEM